MYLGVHIELHTVTVVLSVYALHGSDETLDDFKCGHR